MMKLCYHHKEQASLDYILCVERSFAHKELAEVSWLWVTNAEHAALTSEVATSHPAWSHRQRAKGADRAACSFPTAGGQPYFFFFSLNEASSKMLMLFWYWVLPLRPTALHQKKSTSTLPQIKKTSLGSSSLAWKVIVGINSQTIVCNLETLSSHIANYCTYFLFL